MSQPSQAFYEFGPFRLDAAARVLMRDGAPVMLAPKAVDLLLVLVQNSGRVVGKDELMQTLWPDTIVEENNLTVTMSALRRALGESAEQKYVETLPKRGYRFVAPVREMQDENDDVLMVRHSRAQVVVEEEETEESADFGFPISDFGLKSPLRQVNPQSAIRNPQSVGLGLLLLIGLGVAVSAYWFWNKPKSSGTVATVRSVAVLPFKLLTTDGSDDYLGLGIADTLITKLSHIRQLVVRPTSAVRKYTASDQDPLMAGREQRVDAVLEGSIQTAGEKIRVTVRLLSVQDGSALWAHQSDEQQYANIFVMQDAISEEVASALALQLSHEERERLRKHGTENREAYLLYMKGRYYWNKRSAESLQAALTHFLQAIEQDPLYAQAYVGVADCYAILGDYAVIHPREAMLKAKAVAAKALELDETLAEAHATLGFINSDFDRASAGKELKRAIELNPNYATAHHWYAMHLTFSGRFDDGIAEILRAQELDPLSLAIGAAAGAIFVVARQYDRAFEQFQKLLDMDPNFHRARQFLGLIYSWKGMHEQAIAELQKTWQADQRTEVFAWLGLAYAMAGQRDKARATIAELEKLSKHRYVSPFDMAAIYTALKDNDQAFAWLEKWYEDRPARLGVIRYDPRMYALHADPRFADLLTRVGLENE